MQQKTRSFVYAAILASLATAGLAGCGGNGSNPVPAAGTIQAAGGATTLELTTSTAIPASTDDTVITTDGVETVIPASEEEIPADEEYAVLPEDTAFLAGTETGLALTRGASFYGTITGPGVNNLNVTKHLTTSGRLKKRMAFRRGTWRIRLHDITIRSSNNETLDIADMYIRFTVKSKSLTSFPRTVAGVFPLNGGTLTDTDFVNMSLNSYYRGGNTSLYLDNGTSTLSKSVKVGNNGRVGFQDLTDSGTFVVPDSGLVEVSVILP